MESNCIYTGKTREQRAPYSEFCRGCNGSNKECEYRIDKNTFKDLKDFIENQGYFFFHFVDGESGKAPRSKQYFNVFERKYPRLTEDLTKKITEMNKTKMNHSSMQAFRKILPNESLFEAYGLMSRLASLNEVVSM